MPRRFQNTIAILLVCLIGLSPFPASMAAVMHTPADAASHDCQHQAQQMADHCLQYTGGCDACANCSSHCFPNLPAVFSALFLKSNLRVIYLHPVGDEFPDSAVPSSLFRPPKP